jgi:hypothetical protein
MTLGPRYAGGMNNERGRPFGALEEVVAQARRRHDPRVEATLPEEGAAPVALARLAVVRKVCTVLDGDLAGASPKAQPRVQTARGEALGVLREVLALRAGRRDTR